MLRDFWIEKWDLTEAAFTLKCVIIFGWSGNWEINLYLLGLLFIKVGILELFPKRVKLNFFKFWWVNGTQTIKCLEKEFWREKKTTLKNEKCLINNLVKKNTNKRIWRISIKSLVKIFHQGMMKANFYKWW